MATPARPLEGAPIDVTWGGLVHDAAVAKIGASVGPGASVGAGAILNLAYLAGRASMVDAANKWLLLPVAGVWRVSAQWSATGQAAGALYRVFAWHDATTAIAEAGAGSFGAVSVKASLSTVRVLPAGAKIDFRSGTLQGSGTPAYVLDFATVELIAAELA